ncbi:MAG TPA: HPr family phosphocarrier protein [Kofleriaceae bacterium]|nr:HPr family phosphocarrier protein [Kofleriaceae bacterium]
MMAADERAERTLQIQNELGLHARAGTKFVQLASKFPCDITVTKAGNDVNGKSILSLLTLMAPKGTTITIRARGDRAGEAVAALAALVDDKFGEGK